jgi:hypothetical protein
VRKEADAVFAEIEKFLKRFVRYPSDDACVAHLLWIVHTWFMDCWYNTPRLAFLSPEPASGKSRALEVTESLVPRPCLSVSSTPAYLFRKVSDKAGLPTILYDEIDIVFGPQAKGNEEIRGFLNAGHRRGSTAGRCKTVGDTITTEELPAYCAVAMAGLLHDLPDTIMSRTVVVRMQKRAGAERVQQWRERESRPQAQRLGARIAEWSQTALSFIGDPEIPDGVEDRAADLWEPLLAVAGLAGEFWTARAEQAARAFVAVGKDETSSTGVQLLRDLREIFGEAESLHTNEILEKLVEIPESKWPHFHHDGRSLGPRDLSKLLKNYCVSSLDIRRGTMVKKGYKADELADAWGRYVPTSAMSATSATGATLQLRASGNNSDVADLSLVGN